MGDRGEAAMKPTEYNVAMEATRITNVAMGVAHKNPRMEALSEATKVQKAKW
jgi:hypothetical protein